MVRSSRPGVGRRLCQATALMGLVRVALKGREVPRGERHDRSSAHCVNIRQGVGCSDSAKVVPVVYDRHKKIGGCNQGLLVVQAVDGSVIARLVSYQQIRVEYTFGRLRQDFAQQRWRHLAASPPSMRELR